MCATLNRRESEPVADGTLPILERCIDRSQIDDVFRRSLGDGMFQLALYLFRRDAELRERGDHLSHAVDDRFVVSAGQSFAALVDRGLDDVGRDDRQNAGAQPTGGLVRGQFIDVSLVAQGHAATLLIADVPHGELLHAAHIRFLVPGEGLHLGNAFLAGQLTRAV